MVTKMSQELGAFLLLFSFLFCLFVGRDSHVACMVCIHDFYLKVALNFGGICYIDNHTCI